MNKSNVIKDILGAILFKEGFTYKAEPNVWIFEREHKNNAGELINQEVYVQKSNFGNMLYFRLSTSVWAGLIEAHNLVQDNKYHYSYTTNQEFTDNIKYFTELMESKGFDVLEQISNPVVTEGPSADHQEYLYQNYETLASEFMAEHQVNLDCEQAKLLELVYNFINPLKNESYNTISSELIKLSAFYGKWLINKCTGRWCYDTIRGVEVEVLNRDGYSIEILVLGSIFLCWERIQEYDEIEYKELQPSLLLLDFL